ncbi:MAG TPA: lipopolysaccharide transport periplasmic protein LptA [Pseudomonadota bacterium]|nr:lipopolysaccharide transport periplasmic protein LptA [Xanthomonadales bacterium]HQW80608.1 lipopolysaccharide transport periplasmic protein LptA [Pseudomonadota bacterium]
MAVLLRSASALLVATLMATPAFAAKADREQPMQVGAERSQTSEKTGITVLTGDVHIDQGSLLIRADRGEFEQKEGEVSRVVLDGAPVHLEQDIDQQGRLKADAKRIEYLLAEQKVVMTGGVRIERPRGVLSGERVIYHLDTGEMEAGEPGGRVNMTIAPKPKTQKAAAATVTEAPKS